MGRLPRRERQKYGDGCQHGFQAGKAINYLLLQPFPEVLFLHIVRKSLRVAQKDDPALRVYMVEGLPEQPCLISWLEMVVIRAQVFLTGLDQRKTCCAGIKLRRPCFAETHVLDICLQHAPIYFVSPPTSE